MRTKLTASLMLPLLAGPMMACTTVSPGDRPALSGSCKQDGTDQFIGQMATQEVGAEIQRRTRAKIFQWVPDGSAVTMDFRPDRVRVGYGRDMKINSVRCG